MGPLAPARFHPKSDTVLRVEEPTVASPPPATSLRISRAHPTDPAHSGKLGSLALAALGIVFGDIGTSPLYTLKECLNEEHGVPRSAENTLGVLSTSSAAIAAAMLWTLPL